MNGSGRRYLALGLVMFILITGVVNNFATCSILVAEKQINSFTAHGKRVRLDCLV
jgi:hypothetical protein